MNLFLCDLYFTDMFNCVIFYLEVLFINIILILHYKSIILFPLFYKLSLSHLSF
jgi:hypothetical protein